MQSFMTFGIAVLLMQKNPQSPFFQSCHNECHSLLKIEHSFLFLMETSEVKISVAVSIEGHFSIVNESHFIQLRLQLSFPCCMWFKCIIYHWSQDFDTRNHVYMFTPFMSDILWNHSFKIKLENLNEFKLSIDLVY